MRIILESYWKMIILQYQVSHHHQDWDPYERVVQLIFYRILTSLHIFPQDPLLLSVYDDDSSIHPNQIKYKFKTFALLRLKFDRYF